MFVFEISTLTDLAFGRIFQYLGGDFDRSTPIRSAMKRPFERCVYHLEGGVLAELLSLEGKSWIFRSCTHFMAGKRLTSSVILVIM